jgi:hypothetical protein
VKVGRNFTEVWYPCRTSMSVGVCAQYGCRSSLLPLYIEKFEGAGLVLFPVSGAGWCNVHGVSEAEEPGHPAPRRHLGVFVRGKDATRGERVWRWSEGGQQAMMIKGQDGLHFFTILRYYRGSVDEGSISPVDDLGKSCSVTVRVEPRAVGLVPGDL